MRWRGGAVSGQGGGGVEPGRRVQRVCTGEGTSCQAREENAASAYGHTGTPSANSEGTSCQAREVDAANAHGHTGTPYTVSQPCRYAVSGPRLGLVLPRELRLHVPGPARHCSQGLTLVHFSAQLEPCLTHTHTKHPTHHKHPLTRATQSLRAPPIP